MKENWERAIYVLKLCETESVIRFCILFCYLKVRASACKFLLAASVWLHVKHIFGKHYSWVRSNQRLWSDLVVGNEYVEVGYIYTMVFNIWCYECSIEKSIESSGSD